MTFEQINFLNIFLGSGAILLQILTLASLVLFFLKKKNVFLDFISKNFLFLGFFITFFASIFSLIYSEMVGFAPCNLCWYARVFTFPLVLIFWTAFWYKDNSATKYLLPISLFGFFVSIYHNFRYYFSPSDQPCDSSGVSCYQNLVSEFGGYISIPMLSLTVFVSILVLILIHTFYQKK